MSEFQPFDEQDAIEYIRAMIPRDIAIRIDDDDILFVIDHVWNWYEQHGFLDISLDDTDDSEVDPDAIINMSKSSWLDAETSPSLRRMSNLLF